MIWLLFKYLIWKWKKLSVNVLLNTIQKSINWIWFYSKAVTALLPSAESTIQLLLTTLLWGPSQYPTL